MVSLSTLRTRLWLTATCVLIVPVTATASAATVRKMALGAGHSCVLFTDGILKCFGSNDSGQLGLGTAQNRGGTTGEMGTALPAVDVGRGLTVKDVAAGSRHTCAILSDDSVKCWGDNTFGQLGLGDTTSRGAAAAQMGDQLPRVDLGAGRTAVKIDLGDRHTCAVLDDGGVKCWGLNTYGQLGVGDLTTRGAAAGQMGDALAAVPLGLRALDVSAGGRHTCALLTDHTLRCWGDGALGQLGNGSTAIVGDTVGEISAAMAAVDLGAGHTAAAVYAGFVHTCAKLETGDLKCWGYNKDGRLGLGDLVTRGDGGEGAEMGDAHASVAIAPGQQVREASCGYRHCCATLESRTLKCFGFNLKGSLGLEDGVHRGTLPTDMGDDLPFVNLGDLAAVNQVFVGEYHSCALLRDGHVKCWGSNRYGQLGLGDTRDRGADAQTMGRFLAPLEL
jgi:alpha-tubulin suppressor-like RCC1 family protein